MSAEASSPTSWVGVRCVFRTPARLNDPNRYFEERVTVWQVNSVDEAIARALNDAEEYAAAMTDGPCLHAELAQAFPLAGPPGDGALVFAAVHASDLTDDEFTARFGGATRNAEHAR